MLILYVLLFANKKKVVVMVAPIRMVAAARSVEVQTVFLIIFFGKCFLIINAINFI